MVLESVLISFFYKWLTTFPSTTCERGCLFSIVYSCLFVKDKVCIGAWIYLWAFYFVPLIYISVFVLVPYCVDDCGFVVEPEVRQVDSPCSILLCQDCFGYSSYFFFNFHTNCEIICSCSVKNTIGSLKGIALKL